LPVLAAPARRQRVKKDVLGEHDITVADKTATGRNRAVQDHDKALLRDADVVVGAATLWQEMPEADRRQPVPCLGPPPDALGSRKLRPAPPDIVRDVGAVRLPILGWNSSCLRHRVRSCRALRVACRKAIRIPPCRVQSLSPASASSLACSHFRSCALLKVPASGSERALAAVRLGPDPTRRRSPGTRPGACAL